MACVLISEGDFFVCVYGSYLIVLSRLINLTEVDHAKNPENQVHTELQNQSYSVIVVQCVIQPICFLELPINLIRCFFHPASEKNVGVCYFLVKLGVCV